MKSRDDYLQLAKDAMTPKGGSPYGPAEVNPAQASAYALIAIAESIADNDRVTPQQEMQDRADPQLEHLIAVEAAARKFDEAGTTVNQMNAEQWQAYLELKALFHGGIKE